MSRKLQRPLTLASIPDEAWEYIAALGFDAVWFMGIWERSPAGIRISMADDRLQDSFRRALPDFTEQDNVGSPYCVRRYIADTYFGGPGALAVARTKLACRNIRLILDFVPNHVALDHPWVALHPEYFIQGDAQDLKRKPESFVQIGEHFFACGKDPYFPAWQDVIQLNAFNAGLRSVAIETLLDIAAQCDGVRCDMAMLLMNTVFEKTWAGRAGSKPPNDYWSEVIPAVKKKHSEFRFIAEAYWDLEWELQQQGFDYCYDKRLYDRLRQGPVQSVGLHLGADLAYQEKLVRFVENHDEPRAAAAFGTEKHRAAAVAALTLPGAGLVHEGQLEGRRTHLPVFLARRPVVPADDEVRRFYKILLTTLRNGDFLQGNWQLCEPRGWPDNTSCLNLAAWCWRKESSFVLIVVNLAGVSSQGMVRVSLESPRGRSLQLKEVFTSAVYEREVDEMCGPGIYVDLPPWGFHLMVSGHCK